MFRSLFLFVLLIAAIFEVTLVVNIVSTAVEYSVVSSVWSSVFRYAATVVSTSPNFALSRTKSRSPRI